jgi:hypothetical protein
MDDLTLPWQKRPRYESDDSDSDYEYDRKRNKSGYSSEPEADSDYEYDPESGPASEPESGPASEPELDRYPEPATPDTLAICILAHGTIVTDIFGDPVENQTFPNVYIVKQNVSGFGGLTSDVMLREYVQYTKDVYDNVESCVDPQTYIEKTTKKGNTTTSQKMIDRKELFETGGICQVFKGYTKYYEKLYSGDERPLYNVISFGMMKHGRFVTINILTCSTLEIYAFITSSNPKSSDSDIEKDFYKFCETFTSNRKRVTTTNLFAFIDWFKYYQSINRVNILDMSCNGIPAGIFCDPKDKVCQYKCNPSGMTPNPAIAFGGKTRRKTKPKKTKRRL